METVSYRVRGLDCAEEVAILRQEVGTLPGVANLDFDVLNARMTIDYDPERISNDTIVSAVDATGMKAVPWSRRADEQELTFLERRGRLLSACASGALLLAAFVVHWILHDSLLDALNLGHRAEAHAFPTSVVVLYCAAIITGAWYVVPKAWLALRRLRPDMNLLMMLAVIGAMFIGEWMEAATVTFLFAVALLLEQWSVGRARRAISALMDLSPATARYICPHDGDIEEKPVEQVPVGVTALVRPGEKIPLDGLVTKGASTVNQAPITGESVPVPKEPGDELYAGTFNEDGALEFEVTKPAEDTTLAHIIHLVQETQSRRAPSEQWVEKFARYYTPVMLLLALGLAVFPPLALGESWQQWIYRGLVILVIACPCALVISTPVSVVSGQTSAARNGVLIKGGVYLEAVGRLRALALDKTGTLTHGRPEVQEVVPFGEHTREEVLARAAAMEAASDHPLARAILRAAEIEELEVEPAENPQALKGKGVEATIAGRPFWVGSHRFMEEKGQETPQVHERVRELEDAGHSVVAVGNDQHVCGLISISDRIRDRARGAVHLLKRLGLKEIVMLTGDNEGTAAAVARQVGVDEYRSELMPEDKVSAVEELVKSNEQVGMVGDGVNDAPAMSAATVGIAMGAMGTDIAIETADVALMSDELERVPWLVWHSRRTLAIIKENIIFALGLKFLFVLLALFGLASLWMAIAADMGASLLVTFNGLRLIRAHKRSVEVKGSPEQ